MLYTINKTAPLPYGLWIDLPFRSKSAKTLREEAKTWGVRFSPEGTVCKWWLPSSKITEASVAWMNKLQVFAGVRNAPRYEARIAWSQIAAERNGATVWIKVPFAEKDQYKKSGARWDAVLKEWYYLVRTRQQKTSDLTQAMYDKFVALQLVTAVQLSGQERTSFFAEDMGECFAPAAAPKPTATEQAAMDVLKSVVQGVTAPAPAIVTPQNRIERGIVTPHNRLTTCGIHEPLHSWQLSRQLIHEGDDAEQLLQFQTHADGTVDVLPYVNGHYTTPDTYNYATYQRNIPIFTLGVLLSRETIGLLEKNNPDSIPQAFSYGDILPLWRLWGSYPVAAGRALWNELVAMGFVAEKIAPWVGIANG